MSADKNQAANPPRQRGHVQPRRPVVALNEPGLWRTADVLGALNISHSNLYERMQCGRFPRPDGNDGRNYWHTRTVRAFLEGLGQPPASAGER